VNDPGARTLAIAFLQSLDGLMSYHDARYILVPVPAVAGTLLGELVAIARRTAPPPRLPTARMIPRRRRAGA
jgi:hypothetical protein